ncbi:DEAD/DEAH box helicase, partial [Cooperia oncophora]
NDNEDDDRGRRGNGFKSNGGFGNKNASGFGGGDDYSKGGDQQGVREFYSSGSKQERAPKDWSPENTAIEKLFERDAINAAHFENERDESVQIIGEDNNVEISSWENSGLHPDLIKICTEKCHYKFVRPIQAAAIPLILSGRDVMGLAETGGGKTAAFVLPILHQIMNMGSDALSSLKSGQILALVVAPTRELARQLYDSFRKHAFGTEVNCCVSYGELPRFKSLSEIHKGCHVLVGTSGRLMDFVKRSDINVERLRFLVLDEADMLLESGRENHLTAILSDPSFPKPESRQTLLFSATFPADVERLAGKVLRKKYVTVRTSQRGKANVRVTQKFVQAEGVSGKNETLFDILEKQKGKVADVRTSQRGKANVRVTQKFVQAEGVSGKNETLFDILEKQKGKVADDGSPMRTLVFVETKKRADFLALALSEKGVLAASINGDRPQNERERVVGELREGTLHVLVGTDVCQRGLDIGGLDHVINYDMPTGTPEEARDKYIHRIGRTGRLHGGVATTFVDSRASSDVDLIKLMVQVAKETDQEIPDWLDQMCNRDSFARAGFDSRSTFGAKVLDSVPLALDPEDLELGDSKTVAKETDQEIPEWLDQMCNRDSFARAGFDSRSTFGAKGFGSSSGFGATGFGSGGSGGFGTGGFKDAAKSDKQGNEDAKEDKELGSASFGDGGFGNNNTTGYRQNECC